MNSSKQIKIGAIISYFAIFVNIASGLIYTPWMMNTIGKSDYGLYTLAMSLINTFMIDFGLSMATQRYVSKYLADKSQKSVNDVVGLIYKLYFLITCIIFIVFVVIYFFIGNIYAELTAAEITKFKSLYIVAVIYSVMSFPFIPLNGILSAYEKFVQLKICELIHKFLAVGLTVAALIMGFGVYSLVLVNLISGIIHVVVRLIIVKSYTPLKPKFSYRNNSLLKELFSFSVWTSIFTIVQRFLISLSPSILGIVSGSADIAVFGYAVSLETYIYTFVTAINGFFMPKLSRISANSGKEQSEKEVLNLMISVGRFILMLFALIFVGFLSMGQEFIYLLFGTEYDASYYCTILICAYGVVAYPQQIANTYVMVKNKVKQRAYISIGMFVLNTALSFVLGKFMGAIGVSIAIFISLSLFTVAMNVLYKKSLGIDIITFFKKCHLKLLPAIIVYLVVSVAISFIPIYGWKGFAIKVVCILIAYAIALWFFMLNREEKNFLLRKVKKT